MTKDELNRKAAEALGLYLEPIEVNKGEYIPYAHKDKKAKYGWVKWNPCESVDQIREFIYPEIERRGLWNMMIRNLSFKVKEPLRTSDYMTLDPKLIVQAFIEICGIDNNTIEKE